VTATVTTASAAAALRPDHPLVGLWRLPYPNSACHEIYRIQANGTTLVTSAEEEAESEFTMSDQPSENGFYKWVDRNIRDNGGKDCGGKVTEAGAELTRYVLLHPAGKVFVMCEDEDEELNTCIGPFIRIEEGDGDV
ncbi:MAG: hypothetical protein ABW067_05880, partial [Rhizobacter sp.]